jgi:hypothetical protein
MVYGCRHLFKWHTSKYLSNSISALIIKINCHTQKWVSFCLPISFFRWQCRLFFRVQALAQGIEQSEIGIILCDFPNHHTTEFLRFNEFDFFSQLNRVVKG